MLLERKAKELIGKVITTPVIGFRKLMWTAAGLYLLGTVLPLLSTSINYATYKGPLSSGTFETSTPVTGSVIEVFTLGRFFGPFDTLKSAETAASGAAGFIVDAFIAPPLLIVGIFVGLILTVLPIIIAILLLSGWDRYLRLVGFSYLTLYGLFYFSLATNSVRIIGGFGVSAMLIASALVVIAGLDRAKNWAIIKNNVSGVDRGYVYKPYAGKVKPEEVSE